MEEPDELCAACSKVGIFSLFSGPRYFPGDGFDALNDNKLSVTLGTLKEVNANTRCPFCRLLHHDLYETVSSDYWPQEDNYFDQLKVRIHVRPYRLDYDEVMKYIHGKPRPMVATILIARLDPMKELSEQETLLVRHHPHGVGIQLLSPDYMDPARPLLNGSEYDIRVIDVEQCTIVENNPRDISYAALSYVWGKDNIQNAKLQDQYGVQTDTVNGPFSTLPPNISKIDRYCIDQTDLIRKVSEIASMGYMCQNAKITLITGMGPEAGLLPATGSDHIQVLQRVETVQGRKYITALPSIRDQIHSSEWIRRAWTMQEGWLSNRCAFFGKYDISFMCGSGHWKESLHSGPYAHEAEIADVKIACAGDYLLLRLHQLNEVPWTFADYDSLLRSYTRQELSFESDKLNTITGCFNLITEKKGVPFIYGLPTAEFHYALLWTREYDRPREGFPSWSWAGWHSRQQIYNIYHVERGTCSLEDDGYGNLQTTGPVCRDFELQGILITLAGRTHHTNRCFQRFADIAFPSYKTNTLLIITSELAHFSLEILSCSLPDLLQLEHRAKIYQDGQLSVPHDFDSADFRNTGIHNDWNSTAEYKTPFRRLRLRDDYDNIHTPHYPRWIDHWPPFRLGLPDTLRGGTLAWLLKEGIELVMILELKMLKRDEIMKSFHIVFCLGVDRRGDIAKRCGMFRFPKEIWDLARPKMGTVVMG
ncbi:hypothetical protein G7Y89_g3460 [Cudoniella acicularis]|uniref:Heterokaryon incompatibility domain-containing protein n=1 Tax=Cudoniella acicularis TaxID=354080 RepID=A0A8H4RTE4_9HELO|nr:hypothetical protein G7Y89_g3460 [Cudoniella acicularis]